MIKKICIILFLFYFIFLSCELKNKQLSILNKNVSFREKIEFLLNSDVDEINFINKNLKLKILDYYKKNKFKAIWLKKDTLSSFSNNIIDEVNIPLAFGIPNFRYPLIDKNDNPIINEVKLTCILKILNHDLSYGIMDDSLKKIKDISFNDDFSFLDNLRFKKNDSCFIDIINWGPKDSLYQKSAKLLYELYLDSPKSENKIKLTTQKEDSLKSCTLTKEILFNKKYINNLNCDSSCLFSALRKFQRENGLKEDGKIGIWTAKALMETQFEKCKRIALNLEKLRHKKLKSDYFIEINIPEFKLRFYHFDTLKAEHKVIVGKVENQSPELSSNVFRIITYPIWSVPYSITSKEFLPILKRNPNYLTQNNMILLKNNEEINPKDINWKKISKNTFPYKVIQNSGNSNSLGIIKFDFNNKFGVYLHDTPNKGLFNTIFRSYSHGCIRCEKPVELAKTLLLTNEKNILPDTLDSLITRRKHLYINLKKKIPIEIYYLSIKLNEKGEVVLLPDLYNRDISLVNIMFGNNS